MQRKYTELNDKTSESPHIFATADNAFTAMVISPPGKKANQVRASRYAWSV